MATKLLYLCLLCVSGVLSSENDCPDTYEYNACGSPCARTCENYEDPPICLAVCASGCFCPVVTVEHNGVCITTDHCPGNTTSCPDGYEYKECGSPCTVTCDNYQNPPICTAVCRSGCFCPEGTVELNDTCITTDQCPVTTPSCPDGYEYKECGSPCTMTCDNYQNPPVCTAVCRSGCFCPEGTVELNDTCITTDQCPVTTPSCLDGYEYKECGSPCTVTCDNYDNPPFCTAACRPGCFCPEGTVEHNGMCISTEECPQSCPYSYEYKECGSPCTKTCNNYNDFTGCIAVCESGCFCPDGTVEHNGRCIAPEKCPAVCTGGKEWQDCGTACPLTCDNYDNPPLFCTLQCVQGCFCPAGKVDLNGVCVETQTCAGCQYCQEGQTCAVMNPGNHEYAYCKEPIAVPCTGEAPRSPCPSNYRCVTHNTTGISHCLESCYLQNGGCSEDEVCYYERSRDETCNPLLEPCYHTTCTDDPADSGSCPSGWEINPCGSLCQRSCKDYLRGELLACLEICGPPDCVCPRGMVVFRDRCVDPLECYSLMTDEPDLNPLPLPPDVVLLRVTLVGVEREDVDATQFAEDVGELLQELGFSDVSVSLYAVMEDENGNVMIVLRFKGKSIDGDESADRIVDILMDNPAELNHDVAEVNSVDSRALSSRGGDDDDDDESSESLSSGGVAGIVVALVVLCSALVAIVTVVAVGYLLNKKKTTTKYDIPDVEQSDYSELPVKEELM